MIKQKKIKLTKLKKKLNCAKLKNSNCNKTIKKKL